MVRRAFLLLACNSTPVRFPESVDWGDVPTWIGSTASLLALIAAAIAAVQAKRIYDLESNRDLETARDRQSQEDEKRRAQASKVCIWPTYIGPHVQSVNRVIAVAIRNASELPVYEAVIRVSNRRTGEKYSEVLPVLPPSVSPLEKPLASLLTGTGDSENVPTQVSLAELAVAMQFIDAAGFKWERLESGQLTEQVLHTVSQ